MIPAALLALLLASTAPSAPAVLVCAQEPPIEFMCVWMQREAADHQKI
ncbi:MAG: hypothetical protein ACR2RE_17015 [Geminicoccaceae bacterium]